MPSSLRLGQVSQGRPLAQWPLSVALATAAGKGNTDSVQAWYGSSSGSTACGWGLGLGPAGGGSPGDRAGRTPCLSVPVPLTAGRVGLTSVLGRRESTPCPQEAVTLLHTHGDWPGLGAWTSGEEVPTSQCAGTAGGHCSPRVSVHACVSAPRSCGDARRMASAAERTLTDGVLT